MANILDAAGRKVVYYEHFIAALQVRVGKMRADETGATCNEHTQNKESPLVYSGKISSPEHSNRSP
jgi:hypothetical protein